MLFTIKQTTNSANVYIVEQLTFNEDMTVQISASEFRFNDSDESELAILIKPKTTVAPTTIFRLSQPLVTCPPLTEDRKCPALLLDFPALLLVVVRSILETLTYQDLQRSERH